MLKETGIMKGGKGAIALFLGLMLGYAPASVGVPMGQQSWQWLEAIPGGFRVALPGGVERQEPLVLDLQGGELVLEGAIALHEGNQYVFAFGDYRVEGSPWVRLTMLRDAMVKDTGWVLAEDRSFPLGIHPGREFILFSENELITYRFYLVGERVYILGVLQDAGVDLREEMGAFFGSFGVTR
ncbi:hypothetical protein [Spirulina sp. CCNP1310]|uniref:hypothetical protein n=1 Tax=Spirulina sp. CCNP1310 TaxID=3110249 RepID=UPI002B21282E|nr:hypothetical protein [Spirulina sp. CCNP1310]